MTTAKRGGGAPPRRPAAAGRHASSRAVAAAPWLKPRMPSGRCCLMASTRTSNAGSQPLCRRTGSVGEAQRCARDWCERLGANATRSVGCALTAAAGSETRGARVRMYGCERTLLRGAGCVEKGIARFWLTPKGRDSESVGWTFPCWGAGTCRTDAKATRIWGNPRQKEQSNEDLGEPTSERTERLSCNAKQLGSVPKSKALILPEGQLIRAAAGRA
eukprot:357752-Chlamydomonas_euryale.AAC.7